MTSCKHFNRIEDELIQQVNIMGMAINVAINATTEERRDTALLMGKRATERTEVLFEQVREEAQKCGLQ